MILSELIATIIDLTIEGDKFETQIFEQIEFLTEKKHEHTVVGLFVYLKPEEGIEKYRLSKSQLEIMFGNHNHQLTKFELRNDSLNVLADLTVHFSEGIIDCVEIWNKLGKYPKEEMLSYELRRL